MPSEVVDILVTVAAIIGFLVLGFVGLLTLFAVACWLIDAIGELAWNIAWERKNKIISRAKKEAAAIIANARRQAEEQSHG